MVLFRWIGKLLGSFTRAFRRHRQPCETCRQFVIEYEARLETIEGQFLEALSKYRAQYARLVKREKQLLEEVGWLGDDEAGGEPDPAQLELVPGSPDHKQALRQRARQSGLL